MSASPVLIGPDPAFAAWIAAGSPRVHVGSRAGQCARCLRPGSDHLPVTAVAGENFTSFTGWLGSPAGGICPSCAWVYRTAALRNPPHLITADPASLTALTPAGLYARLLTGAIAPEEALAVPLRPGRKHTLPAAEWGLVAVDDVAIQWTSPDAHRLRLLAELRALGATPGQLQAPVPPWALIKDIPADERPSLLSRWEALTPWRTRGPWMNLGLLATTNRSRAGTP